MMYTSLYFEHNGQEFNAQICGDYDQAAARIETLYPDAQILDGAEYTDKAGIADTIEQA